MKKIPSKLIEFIKMYKKLSVILRVPVMQMIQLRTINSDVFDVCSLANGQSMLHIETNRNSKTTETI